MAIIGRKEWGAQHADGFRDRPVPIGEWWLHHSVTIAPDLLPPFTDDDAAIRTLERIGQSRFGGGISYTFPVTPVGRIYVGHSLPRQGAHTKGHNTVGAAFVLVGDYTKRAPTDAQRDRIAERMVIEHRAGRATTHRLNGGHRDVSATSCPGNAAYAAIADINARADRLWKAGYPTAPAVPKEDDDMPTVHEVWTTDLTKTGTTVGTVADRPLESPLDILTRVARNVELTVALVRAQGNAASVAAEVIKALPADATLDEDTLARAFVAALTQLATPKETTP